MLVLTRKPTPQNDTIIITPPNCPPITVRINSVQGNRVQVGVEAVGAVAIRRGELPRRAAA